jgi:aspartyl-tRNA(Asn)/glutamyl-tRNA(Gln) amidotransferase subunit A
MSALATLSALDAAAKVRAGDASAQEIVEATLARIAALNPKLGAFTDVTVERARTRAAAIDAAKARGETLGPLAGATFAVKNLFDVAGLPTRAGSKINRERAPASTDSPLIAKLEAAGAILVGALNMGEYAYDFTGENAHDGPSHNPHDLGHMSGGSSGGSGSAVGGGLVPLALGSDTNGSIRVPSALCGIFGLKPTYGRLSRARTFPFVSSFDHLGPFARSVGDLAASYDAMQGVDPEDPGQTPRPLEPTLGALADGASGLRIATLGGYFAKGAEPVVFAGLERVARALGASKVVELPEAGRARAAAFLITMAEGGALHLDRLRARAADYDPDTRDRLLAGAMLPAAWVVKAQKLRRWFREQALELFKDVDVLLAPATPARAPALGQKTMTVDGVELPVRANLGLFTQPISFIGLPVVAVPLWQPGSMLPTGCQVIAPPWREDLALRVAAQLEREGVTRAPIGRAAEV